MADQNQTPMYALSPAQAEMLKRYLDTKPHGEVTYLVQILDSMPLLGMASQPQQPAHEVDAATAKFLAREEARLNADEIKRIDEEAELEAELDAREAKFDERQREAQAARKAAESSVSEARVVAWLAEETTEELEERVRAEHDLSESEVLELRLARMQAKERQQADEVIHDQENPSAPMTAAQRNSESRSAEADRRPKRGAGPGMTQAQIEADDKELALRTGMSRAGIDAASPEDLAEWSRQYYADAGELRDWTQPIR